MLANPNTVNSPDPSSAAAIRPWIVLPLLEALLSVETLLKSLKTFGKGKTAPESLLLKGGLHTSHHSQLLHHQIPSTSSRCS